METPEKKPTEKQLAIDASEKNVQQNLNSEQSNQGTPSLSLGEQFIANSLAKGCLPKRTGEIFIRRFTLPMKGAKSSADV